MSDDMIMLSDLSDPLEIHDTFVPWASAVRYLSFVLDSKNLYTQHLHIVANKATAVLCNMSPLPARDPMLTKFN